MDYGLRTNSMRVLLTGGYGCIGSWIVRQLLERGDEAFIYDLKEDPRRMRQIMSDEQVRRVPFVPGDVTDLANLKSAIERHGITHVVHLAGLQVPTCRADPMLGAKVNVLGTLAVFEAVKRKAAGAAARLHEFRRRLRPAGGISARPARRRCAAHAEDALRLLQVLQRRQRPHLLQDNGISSVGLRPWTVFGVGRDFGMTSEPTKAIKSLALRPYHITYGGFQDMQYVEDVANDDSRCLEAPYTGAKSYNLRGHVVDLRH